MLNIIQHSWGKGQLVSPEATGKIKLAFNDPPYNIGMAYDSDGTRDKLPSSIYFDWCRAVIQEQDKLLAPGATFWWLCPNAHADYIGPMLTEIIGPRLYFIVKEETFAQYQRKTLTDDWRALFCHVKANDGETQYEGKKHRPTKVNYLDIAIPSARQEKYGDKRAVAEGRTPGRIWKFRRLQGTSKDHVDWHPCQLPPELLDRIVLGWSDKGDLVMDGFVGSGSMALSAKRNGRNFIGMEQSPCYIKKVKERLETE